MLTEQSNQEKKPLSSNKNLVNSVRTPLKQSSKEEPLKKEKENIKQEATNVLKKEDYEEKIKKYEEDLLKNKEKLKEKTIKENKLLDEINQMRLKMVPLLDKINFLENCEKPNSNAQELENQIAFLKEENIIFTKKNEELNKELLKRDEIFKEWNEVVDQLDSKLNRMEKENTDLKEQNQETLQKEKSMMEKNETLEKEKERLLKENCDILKEKQIFELEAEKLRSKLSEIESRHFVENQEKDLILLDQNNLNMALKEKLQNQKEDFDLKFDLILKENNSLKEKMDIISKKNSFLTNRIYELNKEIEDLKNEKSFTQTTQNGKILAEENLMIRPLNTRKSFELLSDTLTLKLNNLEKIFQNDFEQNRRLSKENNMEQEIKKTNKMITNYKPPVSEKTLSDKDKNKKGIYRSVSATRGRGHESPENQKNLAEDHNKKVSRKKQKNEFESDFVKKFKRVITHLEARLENLATEEINR